MAWQELHIISSAKQCECLAETLSEQGALAITFKDAADEGIFEPPPNTTPHLWQQTLLIALFADDFPLNSITDDLTQQAMTYEIKTIPDEDWQRRCLADFQPMQFGERLWICPSWVKPPVPNAINIILDPGLAFGTGTHATTALCLRWLEKNNVSGKTIIDYGCGSGILAIAALKLGAKHVYCIDHDINALTATRENAQQNQINPHQISISLPKNDLPAVDLLLGNILLEPLISHAEYFAEQVKPAGRILLSGFFANQTKELTQSYQPWFTFETPTLEGEWAAISGSKN